jgi:hypothetical protein
MKALTGGKEQQLEWIAPVIHLETARFARLQEDLRREVLEAFRIPADLLGSAPTGVRR